MNYSINLDITPGGMPPILHMSQYDTGRFYTVNLKSGGGDFTPGLGTTGVVKGVNGKGVAFEIPVTVSGSTATFQLTPPSTDQFGKIAVTLELTIGSNVLSPLAMIFDIQKAGYTNEQAATSPEFQNAMEEAAKKYVLGMDEPARIALLNLLQHVAYTDENGQDYYDALEVALQAKLDYIVADYAQDRTIYNTDPLDKIREGDDLIVTAYFDNGNHIDITDYELSGTLTVGTSEITVSYGGKTTTINVTVTSSAVPIGTPNISDNILTPGSSGMIRSMEAFSPGSSPWKIQVGFTTGSSLSGYQDLIGTVSADGTSQRGLLMEQVYYTPGSRGAMAGYGSNNGSSWNLFSGTVDTTVVANTTYLIQLEFTGTKYKMQYSTDNGATWNPSEYPEISNSNAISGGYYIGIGLNRNGYYGGTIDLTKIKVWIDGALWWKVI